MQRPNVFEDLLDYEVCSWIQCGYGFAGASTEMGNKRMKLEPIIQSEVSQKDKDHYNILTHIYGI